ncbi:MAG: hypothetical protein ACRCRT_03695 [Cetobacterium somerae]
MDFKTIKTFLASNPEIICNILREFRAHGIALSSDNKRIQFGLNGNSSNRAHCIYLDSGLTHFDYPNSITEDFLKFVTRQLNCDYQSAMSFISIFSGGMGGTSYDNEEIIEYHDRDLIEYDDSYLDSYDKCISELFINDGIPPTVQSIFGIRFSEKYNRVLIPIYQKGKLVGIFGRYNQKHIESEYIPKYYPLLAYQKGKVLYPWDINSEYVRKVKKVFLVESEKTPMLCYKYGIRNVFALGGNAIKSHQIELLKELGVTHVCLALDKGLERGYIQLIALRLKEHGFHVSYVDVDNIDYLPDKESVFDLQGKDLIIETIKKYSKEV